MAEADICYGEWEWVGARGIVPGYGIQVSRQHVFAFHKVQTIHQRSTRVAARQGTARGDGG